MKCVMEVSSKEKAPKSQDRQKNDKEKFFIFFPERKKSLTDDRAEKIDNSCGYKSKTGDDQSDDGINEVSAKTRVKISPCF